MSVDIRELKTAAGWEARADVLLMSHTRPGAANA